MRIVIGVDASDESATACAFVAGRSWPVNTEVRLVAIIEPAATWVGFGVPDVEVMAARRAELEAVLDEQAEKLRRRGLGCDRVVVIGRAADVLIDHASQWFADLIVVGSRGLGPAASVVLGSVSAHLVDHAPCPVLVARTAEVSRMLLATDGTRSSMAIPRILSAWSPGFMGVPVEVLSIASESARTDAESELPDGGLELHRQIAADVAEEMGELGWHASAVTRAGDPPREIVSAADTWRADLIVTGSRGLGTLQRLLLGSVAHSVLLHSRASVLVMRGGVVARPRVASHALAAFG